MTIDHVPIMAPRYPSRLLQQLPKSRFIECNMSRARQYYRTNERDESEKATDFRKKARNILKLAKGVLDRLGVRFWLSSGTCLGAYLLR